MPRRRPPILCLGVLLALAGCGRPPAPTLTLATTTSTQDTGLLDALLPRFREAAGVEVKAVAVGSGQALELGRRGDADVLRVHDPAGEAGFMADGFGESRRPVCYNDFVLVGPPADPARVKGDTDVAAAFARIARAGAPFVSRGDGSGTHKKERTVWNQAGIEPGGSWYVRAGAGMAQVLRMASEKRAYTLTDRGTFLAQRGGLGLAILGEGDPRLRNEYHVLVVSPARHPHVRHAQAEAFARFLTSPGGQKIIAEFGTDRFGTPLFRAADR